MKKINKLALIAILTISCLTSSIAQNLTLVDSLKINTPTAVSTDRLSNIYIADKKGNLSQYAEGKLIQTFSPQQTGDITLVEAWNPLKIFVFYADFQEYLFLDRFLTSPQRFKAPEESGFEAMMTLSNDNNLWIVDYANFGLKKYNINFRQYTISTRFDLLLDPNNYDITFIKEYQNLLFMSDRNKGILVFDNLGNYLKTIPANNINYFNFRENMLYYISDGQLITHDIYSDESTRLEIPMKNALYALMHDKQVSFITDNYLYTYKFDK